jgi:uncharacterized LabA/DUF88 family protein
MLSIAWSKWVPESRLAVFIDGSSLFYSTRALGFDVDFKRLLAWLNRHGTLLRAYYYATLYEDRDHQSTRPLLDWLDYNGFTVKAKPIKEYDDGNGRRKAKRTISIDIAVDALEVAQRVDKLMLFSGDGNLRRFVEAIQRHGVLTTVVSTIRTPTPMLADELRRQVDEVIDLEDIRLQVGRVNKPSAG